MEIKELKVGDIIYQRHYTNVLKLVIDRVTAKRAYAGHNEFKREYIEGSSLNEVGAGKWNTTYYYIETEKLKLEYQHKQMLYKVQKFDFSKLSFEKLLEINSIISPSK